MPPKSLATWHAKLDLASIDMKHLKSSKLHLVDETTIEDLNTRLDNILIELRRLRSTISKLPTLPSPTSPSITRTGLIPRVYIHRDAAQREVNDLQARIEGLSSKSSAKDHRILLEVQSTAKAKLKSITNRIDGYRAKGCDILTIAGTGEVYSALKRMIEDESSASHIRNIFIHACLLALLSSTIDASMLRQCELIVQRCKQLIAMSHDGGETDPSVRDLFTSVIESPVLCRLPTFRGIVSKSSGEKSKVIPISISEKRFEEIEFWLLSQVAVSDAELWTDSFAIVPKQPDEAHDKLHRPADRTQTNSHALELSKSRSSKSTRTSRSSSEVSLSASQQDQVMQLLHEAEQEGAKEDIGQLDQVAEEQHIQDLLDRARRLLDSEEDD